MIRRAVEAMTKLKSAAKDANTPFLRWFLGGTAVALAAFGVYANTLSNGFVWDDKALIVDNPFVRDWNNVKVLLSPAYFLPESIRSVENAARPMWILSALVDVKLWGLSPAGHHLTNVLIHAVNSLLVFGLGAAFGGPALAVCAGLLFAVHPVHAEAVAVVGFRADLLAAMFFLAALLSYKLWTRREGTGAREIVLRAALLGASVAAYGAGLLSKEMAITLPAVLVLHDLLMSPGPWRAVLRRRAPAYAAYAALAPVYLFFHAHRSDHGVGALVETLVTKASSWLTLAASVHAEFVATPTPSPTAMLAGDPLSNFFTMSTVAARYLGLLLWPFTLRAEHAVAPHASPDAQVLLALAAIAAAAAIAVPLARRAPAAALGLLGFFVTLLPVSNFQPIYNLMAERYLYLPSVLFCLAAACGMTAVWRAARARGAAARGAAALAAAALLAAFAVRTVTRNADWRDEKTLWTVASRQSPTAARAWYNLGVLARQEGDAAAAKGLFRRALVLRPDYVEARTNLAALSGAEAIEEYAGLVRKNVRTPVPSMNLAGLLVKEGKFEEALRVYRDVERNFAPHEYSIPALFMNMAKCHALLGDLSMSETYFKRVFGADAEETKARLELGKIFESAGRWTEAEGQYRAAIRMTPGSAQAHVNLGVALHQMGRLREAAAELEQGVALRPKDPVAHYDLGTVYSDMSELGRAEASFRAAIDLRPRYEDAHYNIAVVHQRSGRIEEAARSYRRVLEISPRRVEALSNLGGCYLSMGRLAEAGDVLRRAIQADPSRSAPYVNMGSLLVRQGNVQEAIPLFQKAIRLDPMDAMAYNNLAVCFIKQGDLVKAEQEVLSAIRADPRLPDAHFYLGTVYARTGRMEDAVKAWSRTLELQPSHGAALKALERAGAAGFK